MPYCTAWHRDWRDNATGLKLSEWDSVFHDINFFNQINCSLYDDSSLWVVPGSHLRRDLPGEAKRFPDRPIPTPNLEGVAAEERERICLDYCRSMTGAVRLYLDAGDFALYRNTLWHLGNYVPYRKRATLHDVVDTPEYAAWRERIYKEMAERRKAGIRMENPNRGAHEDR
jgi:ectoine hydroxylase-related dioxygenase (phytanoyl-CoA dioxygenase family)